ncbi:diacylglycerol kinase family lipid kinase [Rossellomorea vietnamensis]|uniref:Diacylglycerol kinase family lipid kinase n=1 Tax=Rossellomorea vietnamensis TaxID=218284 RepID=A0A5D4MAH2_9BACI|nr:MULTISPECIES: diacylglycerol kinase family protein [Bacillaceae]TYR98005.1 diacylglycerol kinase family lipid kinase [Rossellomorea vietnamensis]
MNRYKNALLIYNGKAGQDDMDATLGNCIGELSSCCDELTLYGTKDKSDAERVCREKGGSYELLIILGGDGTVHECINGLAELPVRPKAAILPAGTCNDFSRSLRIPQDIKQAAQLIKHGGTEEIDIVKANDRYFSNFWGLGIIADASKNVNEAVKGVFGKLSYYLSAFQTLQEAKIFTVQAEIDGKAVEEEAVMVFVANGRFIGTSELPLPPQKYNDGVVDIFIIKEAGFKLLKELLAAKGTGKLNEKSGEILHFQAHTASISTSPIQNIDMDGEVYTETPTRMEVMKHHIPFIVGEEERKETAD